MNEHVETVVIGAGQAGLAAGYHLQRLGIPFVIVDGGKRVGDNWRRQWDSLQLYSPAKYDGPPGTAFPGAPWSYPGKEEVADFLESYAVTWRLPVRLGVGVRSLDATSAGFFVATEAGGIECDNVVVATGTFGRTPNVPQCAGQLDSPILQLHSSEYRRPDQLADGPVLVVGASHSGADIAYEVAQTHPTVLCGRDCGSIPFRPGSIVARLAFPVVVFAWRHVLTRRTPIGRKMMPHVRFHGAPMLRVKRSDLASRGVRRVEQRVVGARDGRPEFADGATAVWNSRPATPPARCRTYGRRCSVGPRWSARTRPHVHRCWSDEHVRRSATSIRRGSISPPRAACSPISGPARRWMN